MNYSGIEEALDGWETDGGPSAPTPSLPTRNPQPPAFSKLTNSMRPQSLFGIVLMVAGLVFVTAGMNFSQPFAIPPSYFIAGGSISAVGLFIMLFSIRKGPPKQPSLGK